MSPALLSQLPCPAAKQPALSFPGALQEALRGFHAGLSVPFPGDILSLSRALGIGGNNSELRWEMMKKAKSWFFVFTVICSALGYLVNSILEARAGKEED